MSSSIPLQIAETLQIASINRNPSAAHDINPSTAASQKEAVTIHNVPVSEASLPNYGDDDYGLDEDEDDEDISYSILKPVPRKKSFGPLPDLRFEQSYLASIASADTRGRIVWITIRDQVLMPLLQGTIWTLALHGWRFWNGTARLHGNTVGARIRRWWYRTNNWPLNTSMKDFSKDAKLAAEMGDYYQNRSSGD